jgi:hypothetical protein
VTAAHAAVRKIIETSKQQRIAEKRSGTITFNMKVVNFSYLRYYIPKTLFGDHSEQCWRFNDCKISKFDEITEPELVIASVRFRFDCKCSHYIETEKHGDFTLHVYANEECKLRETYQKYTVPSIDPQIDKKETENETSEGLKEKESEAAETLTELKQHLGLEDLYQYHFIEGEDGNSYISRVEEKDLYVDDIQYSEICNSHKKYTDRSEIFFKEHAGGKLQIFESDDTETRMAKMKERKNSASIENRTLKKGNYIPIAKAIINQHCRCPLTNFHHKATRSLSTANGAQSHSEDDFLLQVYCQCYLSNECGLQKVKLTINKDKSYNITFYFLKTISQIHVQLLQDKPGGFQFQTVAF